MKTFGEQVVEFNQNLDFSGKLPEGFRVLNPYIENPETMVVMKKFYQKYYNDHKKRRFIIGINPGRLGAGTTGVPFTDTKRLEENCKIKMESAHTHEVSSVFVYDMISEFGGEEKFYKEFYINSPFPLALIRKKKGNWINANYYDDATLFEAVKPFMMETIEKHLLLGLDTEEVFVLGKKNLDFIKKINLEGNFFKKLTVLEHPRYIQQYKSKEKELYISKYLLTFLGKQS